MQNRFSSLLLVFASSFWAVSTHAAPPPSPAAFAPILAAAAERQPGIEVLTRADLRNLIDHEAEKELMGCEAESCLAEISDALGADLVMFCAVSQLGSALVVSVTLHTSTSKIVGRKVVQGETAEQIGKQLPAVVNELLGAQMRVRRLAKKIAAKNGTAKKTRLLINYREPPKPTVKPATNSAATEAMIAKAKRAARKSIAEAQRRAAEMARVAMENARLQRQGFLGDVAGVARCVERGVPRLLASEARYRSWRDENGDAPPTCDERYLSYGLYEGYDDAIATCRGAIARSAPEIRDAFGALTAALATAMPIVDEASRYYDDEDYEDDDCAKGKELHPKLLAAFAEIRKTLPPLMAQFDDVAAERTRKSAGSTQRQALGQVVHLALQAAAIAPLTNKGAATEAQLKALQKRVGATRAALKKAKQLGPPKGVDPDNWKSLRSRLQDEERWWKKTARALRKPDEREKLLKRGPSFDPTDIRSHAIAMSFAMASSIP